MNTSIQPVVSVVLAWLMAATLASCALAPPREVPAQIGRVLDEETQQPIEGAIVVFRWQGVGTKAFVDTQTVCYHVESAVTDAEGRYTTASWKEESRYRDLSMKQVLDTAYKAGYMHTRTDRTTGDQTLRKDNRGSKERLEYLDRAAVFCPGADESMRKLLPLYKALYAEASDLAKTNEERIEALYHLKRVEILEVGSDEAWRRFRERQREFK